MNGAGIHFFNFSKKHYLILCSTLVRSVSGEEEHEDGENGQRSDFSNSDMSDAADSGDERSKRSSKRSATSSKKSSRESSDESRSSTPLCDICCAQAADTMSYVRCDSCSTVFHLDCVKPTPLARKPRGEWQCQKCMSKSNKRRNSTIATDPPKKPTKDAYEYHSHSSNSSSGSTQPWSASRTDQLMKKAEHLVGELIKHEDSWPFHKPVSKKQVPDYFDVVRNPMDLGTIKMRMNDVAYHNINQLLDDCLLVFNNCFLYNEEGDDVFNMGLEVFRLFMRRVVELQLNLSWHKYKEATATLSKYVSDKRNGAPPSKQARKI